MTVVVTILSVSFYEASSTCICQEILYCLYCLLFWNNLWQNDEFISTQKIIVHVLKANVLNREVLLLNTHTHTLYVQEYCSNLCGLIVSITKSIQY